MLAPLNRILSPLGVGRPLSAGGDGDITSGLLGRWKLNGDATDSSGNGFNGTLYNSPAIGASYASFNGTNAINCGDVAGAGAGATALTFSCWAKITGTPGTIFSKYRGGVGAWFLSYSNASRRWTARIFTSGGNLSVTGASAYPSGSHPGNDSQWYFVCAVYDASTLSLYINNALYASGSITGTVADGGGNYPVIVGGEYSATSPNYTNFAAADIDDCRVYNRALDSTERATLYANGAK